MSEPRTRLEIDFVDRRGKLRPVDRLLELVRRQHADLRVDRRRKSQLIEAVSSSSGSKRRRVAELLDRVAKTMDADTIEHVIDTAVRNDDLECLTEITTSLTGDDDGRGHGYNRTTAKLIVGFVPTATSKDVCLSLLSCASKITLRCYEEERLKKLDEMRALMEADDFEEYEEDFGDSSESIETVALDLLRSIKVIDHSLSPAVVDAIIEFTVGRGTSQALFKIDHWITLGNILVSNGRIQVLVDNIQTGDWLNDSLHQDAVLEIARYATTLPNRQSFDQIIAACESTTTPPPHLDYLVEELKYCEKYIEIGCNPSILAQVLAHPTRGVEAVKRLGNRLLYCYDESKRFWTLAPIVIYNPALLLDPSDDSKRDSIFEVIRERQHKVAKQHETLLKTLTDTLCRDRAWLVGQYLFKGACSPL